MTRKPKTTKAKGWVVKLWPNSAYPYFMVDPNGPSNGFWVQVYGNYKTAKSARDKTVDEIGVPNCAVVKRVTITEDPPRRRRRG